MAIQDESLLAADRRNIALRLRPDLVIQESIYLDERCWVVKDPIAMKYFRLQEPEYVAMLMLKEPVSYRDIKQALDQRFPDRLTRIDDVQRLVSSFHEQGLLISNAARQAGPLIKRKRKETKQKMTQLMTSVLALRLPGIDPERFLSWLYPKIKWLFSGTAFFLICILCGSATMLVLQNLDEIYRRLPGFYQFFGFENIVLMGVILIVTKSIHELGHGMMCKHYGGECHEIGFMLLVLTPAMFCNTSDSWILPNKWHRMAIGAAGMYVEVVMAAICTFIWWYTQPGWIHYLALNIIFLCSVSTILFNANPLLRYDGYYILSDWLEIPNLSQKSRMALLSKLRTVCLGMDPVPPRFLPQKNQWFFAMYSVASFFYRWFVLIMIMYFLSTVFEPYGLQVIGYSIIAMSIVGLIIMPFFKMWKFFRTPGRTRQVKRPRLIASLVVGSLLISAIFVIPIPHFVQANVVVRPKNADYVYVSVSGILERVDVKPGARVEKGQVLAELVNDQLLLELESLQGKVQSLRFQRDAYEMAAPQNLQAASKVGELEAMLLNAKQQLALRKQDLEQLELRTNRAGRVIAPPDVGPSGPMQQAAWSGTPLDEENIDALLPEQTLFCIIGDPNDLKAVLIVEQTDVKFLQAGQPVEMMFDEFRGERLKGEITSISRTQLEKVPSELSKTYGGPIGAEPGPAGAEVPQLTYFEAIVPLGDPSVELQIGFRGKAKIRVGDASIGSRVVRFLKTVINFR